MASSGDQHWNPEQYGRNAPFVSDLGAPLVELLAPQPGERILDLGCGDGALTLRLLEHGCSLVAVDASAEMVEAARALGLDARSMDGQALAFANEFDAVFTNAALHWMPDPEAVIAGVWNALRPGGRFVGECGGHGNVAAIVAALDAALASRGKAVACPWFFPTPDDYAALPPGERVPFIAEVVAALRPLLCDGRGDWRADYVRLRFHAGRPGTGV
ncbi:MAG: class I SAM-dependent methyltransferase [Cyanobacteriota bacterium]|jgi:SAM-dependent methyltransferase